MVSTAAVWANKISTGTGRCGRRSDRVRTIGLNAQPVLLNAFSWKKECDADEAMKQEGRFEHHCVQLYDSDEECVGWFVRSNSLDCVKAV